MEQSRLVIISSCAVALCAFIALAGWFMASHKRQATGGVASSTLMAAEGHREQRVQLKKAELDREGVIGDEREKQLQAEKQAAATEFTHTIEAKSGNTVHITVIARPKDMP